MPYVFLGGKKKMYKIFQFYELLSPTVGGEGGEWRCIIIITLSLWPTPLCFINGAAGRTRRVLQRRIANSVVAPFNWCEITFFGGGASNRLTPEIIEFDTVDEPRP